MSSEVMETQLSGCVCVCVCVCQRVVRAVTGSVSWALPFGFVTDFRGRGGGQEEDGGKERK